jgi:hypothetical protein
MENRNITKYINIYNGLALSLIVFGVIIIINTVPITQLSRLSKFISPFVGVIMFIVKYIQSVKKEEKKNIESLERSVNRLQQSFTLLDAQLGEINITLLKNTTKIAINEAKIEIIGKYGQLEERIKQLERQNSDLD